MKYLDQQSDHPEAWLACEEALLDWHEENAPGFDTLFCWESPVPFVVVGYSNRLESEVQLEACRREGIPVLRRISGGGTVVQGPGCLNYALVCRMDPEGEFRDVVSTNGSIMKRHAELMSRLAGRKVRVEGHSDLAIDGRKFSGNAQRRRRHHLLFHGSILHDFDLTLLPRYLKHPTQEPGYRDARPHEDFVMNLPLPAETLVRGLQSHWAVDGLFEACLAERAEQLAAIKYSTREWNERL